MFVSYFFFFKQKTAYEMRISDWSSDVCSSDLLTTEEHGAYLLLLMAAWGTEDCSLPYDERRLAALSKTTVQRWRKIAPNVLEFWTIEWGRIWQKRLMKEWLYVREKSNKARAAVSMRTDRRGYERNTNVGTNDLHLGGGDRKSKRLNSSN